VSQKYQALAGDSQIWKEHYYNRFVRPRASRLPGLKDVGVSPVSLQFASKASRWLEDEHLVKRGVKTNWKRQYKLRHNWAKGSCGVKEIQVAEQAPVPPVLVQMHDSVIYLADQANGLRAWSTKGPRKILAQTAFISDHTNAPPTSIAVDTQAADDGCSTVVVGFENGAFSLYKLRQQDARFVHTYSHEPSVNGVISAVAISGHYVVTMTATQLLSLYQFSATERRPTIKLDSPRLLHSLKSHTVWPPLSATLRSSTSSIVVSIAYALPTYLSGWTVGIQEVKVSSDGDFLESRLASAIDQHYRPLAFAAPPMMHHLTPLATGSLATSTGLELRHIHAKPISLSYTHPYLLVSHPDNTLALYLVNSTTDSLSISAGSRLWGHTSSVSGAHVGSRGKAVSVSRGGDELRVWELEGGFASSSARKRLATGDLSVRIRADVRDRSVVADVRPHVGLDLIGHALAGKARNGSCAVESRQDPSELTLSRGWIGFDEENVVVLKEQNQGRQALVVYDFT